MKGSDNWVAISVERGWWVAISLCMMFRKCHVRANCQHETIFRYEELFKANGHYDMTFRVAHWST